MNRKIILIFILLSIIMYACSGDSVPSVTDSYTIDFGQTQNEYITEIDAHGYSFLAERSDEAKIRAHGDELSIILYLLDPRGNVIGKSEDSDCLAAGFFIDPNNYAEIAVALPSAGEYTILVDIKKNSCRKSGKYELTLSGTRKGIPISTDGAQESEEPLSSVELGEIIVEEAQLSNVVGINTIELPNCEGTSELTIRKSYTKNSERKVIIFKGAHTGIDLGILQADIEARFIDEDTRTLSETIEAEMHAAPGTMVTYEIEWIEISTHGSVEVISGDSSVFVEFSIVDSLDANIRPPVPTDCSNSSD